MFPRGTVVFLLTEMTIKSPKKCTHFSTFGHKFGPLNLFKLYLIYKEYRYESYVCCVKKVWRLDKNYGLQSIFCDAIINTKFTWLPDLGLHGKYTFLQLSFFSCFGSMAGISCCCCLICCSIQASLSFSFC